MLVTLAEIVIEVKPEQPANAFLAIHLTLSGIVIEVKPVQSMNAAMPMNVTLSGIVIEVKPLQPQNAPSLMLVTLSGIVTEVKPLQFWNASSPMWVTGFPLYVEGITIFPLRVCSVPAVTSYVPSNSRLYSNPFCPHPGRVNRLKSMTDTKANTIK